jgi:hypothetical protein
MPPNRVLHPILKKKLSRTFRANQRMGAKLLRHRGYGVKNRWKYWILHDDRPPPRDESHLVPDKIILIKFPRGLFFQRNICQQSSE